MATFQIKADSTTTTTTTTTNTARTKTIATAKLTNKAGVITRTTIKSYQHPPLKPHSEELEQQQQKPTKPAEVTATTAASAEVVVYQLKPRQSQVRNVLLKNNSQQQKQTQQQQQQQQILEIQSQQQQELLQQQRGDTLCSDAAHSPHSLSHQQQQNQQQQQQQLQQQQQQQRPPRHHQHYHHHQQHQHPNISSRSTVTQPHQLRHCRRCPLGLTARLLRRSSSLRLGTKFKFSPTDSSLFMMITMLVVVTVVISGNAVFAAQRDSYKPKDPHSLSNNANAIPNAISGTGNAVSNGNTNNVSNGNTNSNSASSHSNSNSNNGNNATNTDNDSQTTSLTSSTSAATTSKATTTITLTTSTTTTTTTATSSNGASSYSLQKGGGSSSSGTSGINRNTIEVMDDGRNGPYFDKAASKNITALLGKTAYLNCRVKNLGNKTMLLQVSWVRHRDIHLLTVGRYTYTSDQRFRAIHQPQTEDWILQIKYPQHRDSGIYECQVSTTPHMSHYIHLNVVEPSTEIIGAPDLYIESGSTINLTCVILNSPEPPAYIFWNHNNAIINYDSPRGGVSVVTNKGETTTSFLLIKSARPSDSGHYQCNPSNAKPKSVTVHVLNGEFPAAMQHAALAHRRMSLGRYLLVCLSIYCCSLAYVMRSMLLPAVAN